MRRAGPDDTASGAIRPERLRQRADFLALRKGLVARSQYFTVQVSRRPRDDGDAVRAGLTVTRKVGNAVERNRIKRRLRAALEPALHEIASAIQGRDVAVIARRGVLDAPFDDLTRELRRTVTKALQPRAKARGRGHEAARSP